MSDTEILANSVLVCCKIHQWIASVNCLLKLEPINHPHVYQFLLTIQYWFLTHHNVVLYYLFLFSYFLFVFTDNNHHEHIPDFYACSSFVKSMEHYWMHWFMHLIYTDKLCCNVNKCSKIFLSSFWIFIGWSKLTEGVSYRLMLKKLIWKWVTCQI